MIRFTRTFAALAVIALLLAPSLADARAGSSGSGYSSMGSRGSRTYDGLSGAQPMGRSIIPPSPTTQSTGPAWNTPGYGGLGYGYGRHSFWSGLGAGLFGAWIGSFLFGGPAYASDGFSGHSGGLFGTLMMFAVLFWIGRIVWRSIGDGIGRGGFANGFRPIYSGMAGGPASGFYRPMPRAAQPALTLTDRDLQSFTSILTGVQTAWGKGDLAGLSRLVTPEMLAYFSEQLSNNASQGVANRVEAVTLLKGDPRESWSEGLVDYATAWLRWSAIDYTERALADRSGRQSLIVDGNPHEPIIAEEFWTFRRAAGGTWLLSAIQQRA